MDSIPDNSWTTIAMQITMVEMKMGSMALWMMRMIKI